MGVVTLGLLGGEGGALVNLVAHALVVPVQETARVQECHILIGLYLVRDDSTPHSRKNSCSSPVESAHPLRLRTEPPCPAGAGEGVAVVLVAGEISNLSRAASGHWYFTLKDAQAGVRLRDVPQPQPVRGLAAARGRTGRTCGRSRRCTRRAASTN